MSNFPYSPNDVVLARVPSGRIYYVKIQSVSNARRECVAQFDDGSIAAVEWSNIFDVSAETDVIVCVVCKQGESQTPNEIILCDKCNVGFHQLCHVISITADDVSRDKWYCHYCTFKRANPHIANPFNEAKHPPSKQRLRKRCLTTPTKTAQKSTAKKRKVTKRNRQSSHMDSSSIVARKCTVSIVKKKINKKNRNSRPRISNPEASDPHIITELRYEGADGKVKVLEQGKVQNKQEYESSDKESSEELHISESSPENTGKRKCVRKRSEDGKWVPVRSVDVSDLSDDSQSSDVCIMNSKRRLSLKKPRSIRANIWSRVSNRESDDDQHVVTHKQGDGVAPVKRPVNAVLPIHHETIYPSPPPLQLAPKTSLARGQSYSKPPPLAAKEVTHNTPGQASILTLPPLLKPRHTALMGSKSGIEISTTVSQPSDSLVTACKSADTSDSDTTSHVTALPSVHPQVNSVSHVTALPNVHPQVNSVSQVTALPSVHPQVNSVSQVQLQTLYLQLYNLVQENMGQNGSAINSQLVQDLLRFGSEQMTKLSSTSTSQSTSQSTEEMPSERTAATENAGVNDRQDISTPASGGGMEGSSISADEGMGKQVIESASTASSDSLPLSDASNPVTSLSDNTFLLSRETNLSPINDTVQPSSASNIQGNEVKRSISVSCDTEPESSVHKNSLTDDSTKEYVRSTSIASVNPYQDTLTTHSSPNTGLPSRDTLVTAGQKRRHKTHIDIIREMCSDDSSNDFVEGMLIVNDEQQGKLGPAVDALTGDKEMSSETLSSYGEVNPSVSVGSDDALPVTDTLDSHSFTTVTLSSPYPQSELLETECQQTEVGKKGRESPSQDSPLGVPYPKPTHQDDVRDSFTNYSELSTIPESLPGTRSNSTLTHSSPHGVDGCFQNRAARTERDSSIIMSSSVSPFLTHIPHPNQRCAAQTPSGAQNAISDNTSPSPLENTVNLPPGQGSSSSTVQSITEPSCDNSTELDTLSSPNKLQQVTHSSHSAVQSSSSLNESNLSSNSQSQNTSFIKSGDVGNINTSKPKTFTLFDNYDSLFDSDEEERQPCAPKRTEAKSLTWDIIQSTIEDRSSPAQVHQDPPPGKDPAVVSRHTVSTAHPVSVIRYGSKPCDTLTTSTVAETTGSPCSPPIPDTCSPMPVNPLTPEVLAMSTSQRFIQSNVSVSGTTVVQDKSNVSSSDEACSTRIDESWARSVATPPPQEVPQTIILPEQSLEEQSVGKQSVGEQSVGKQEEEKTFRILGTAYLIQQLSISHALTKLPPGVHPGISGSVSSMDDDGLCKLLFAILLHGFIFSALTRSLQSRSLNLPRLGSEVGEQTPSVTHTVKTTSDSSSVISENQDISGQCDNCYSEAKILCKKCHNAVYCSTRCQIEHLAIHRRECFKR